MNNNDKKRIEQAEYRAKLVEAELNAVRNSKAYKLSKKLGIIKAQIKSDPVGLSKKVARIIVTDPKKARHMFRSASRGALIAQSVVEQNTKYQEWILLNEPDESELDEQRAAAQKLAYQPLISIVTPVFNPPVPVLEELIESVLEQTYTNFELCLGNFGDQVAVEDLIKRYAKLDRRVKYYQFAENKGIAGNSNQILEKVEGEFIALLDHDDTLSPDALYENALLLNQKPYDFIYSDKDKIDEQGNRFDPLFKPELSPEMLLNINYLTHLNIMRTELVKRIGGWDPDTDGAQDWDLFLRVVSEAKHVGFIPNVLYHWRVLATSTALSIETKPYALAAQCKAVDKYLIKNNIPARAYVLRTELFLRWDPKVIDGKPLIFLYYTNLPNTLRIMRRARKVAGDPTFVILVKDGDKKQAASIEHKTDSTVLTYGAEDLGAALNGYLANCKMSPASVVLFMLDYIRMPSGDKWYENLTGWLNIKGVSAASGRLVDRHDLIVSSGGLVTAEKKYYPLFYKYPRYYQSYLGNAEWIRNLSIISPVFFATKLQTLKSFNFAEPSTQIFDKFFLNLSSKGRLVMSPHATGSIYEDSGMDVTRDISPKSFVGVGKTLFRDPYNNPNLSPSDPLRLFSDEYQKGIDEAVNLPPVDMYQHDATILADTFDISNEEIEANKYAIQNNRLAEVESVAWFLPSFDALYAGLMNIFNFANYMAQTKHLATTIYVLKAGNDADSERDMVIASFPALRSANFIAITSQSQHKIKPHDIGIATQWATTFSLAKTNMITKKCYFIQDHEANFYPKGTISALVELGYRFGFTALAGTKGLLDLYSKTYGGDGVVLKSKVDLSAYHPRPDLHYGVKKPYKVFFYARPNMPRNAFELGIAGLKQLKQQLGQDIEIITAGANWDAESYGVGGMFTNLGKINYDAVPKLYRSVDAGLMFMFSGHPGVTASELMASGCPVVVNEYDDVTWHELYQHEKTCIVSTVTASEVARSIRRCLEDPKLRRKIIDGGLEKARSFYVGYEESQKIAYDHIIKAK